MTTLAYFVIGIAIGTFVGAVIGITILVTLTYWRNHDYDKGMR